MVVQGKRPNLGTQIHVKIRADILNGQWAPGDRLRPAELSTHYNTSSTVVRESLTKLVGEKLVGIEPNRGFFVPNLSLDELKDLTELRCVVETLGVQLSLERGDLTWETELIACHHRLARTPRRVPGGEHFTDEWEVAHQAFHAKLLEASGVPTLIDIAGNLAATTQVYRRWTAPTAAAGVRGVEQEHEDIMTAAIARDATKTTELLRRHYERTLDIIVGSGLLHTS